MPKRTKNIMGINPGTRYLGFAVFQGPELRDWGVKVATGKAGTKRLKKIVLGLIEQYEPEVLAVKKLHPSRSSPELNRFTNDLKKLAASKGIRVEEYPIGRVKELLGAKNKLQLAEKLCQDYPHLYPELEKEIANKNSYHTRMFEAVALGHACLREFDG